MFAFFVTSRFPQIKERHFFFFFWSQGLEKSEQNQVSRRWNSPQGVFPPKKLLHAFMCRVALCTHPPPSNPSLPALISLSLAVTTAHRGWAAHLGQVKWSCLVCSVSGSACVAGWGGEGVAGLRFTAGIRQTWPHTSLATLLITRVDCLTKSEQRLRPREKVFKPCVRTQGD